MHGTRKQVPTTLRIMIPSSDRRLSAKYTKQIDRIFHLQYLKGFGKCNANCKHDSESRRDVASFTQIPSCVLEKLVRFFK